MKPHRFLTKVLLPIVLLLILSPSDASAGTIFTSEEEFVATSGAVGPIDPPRCGNTTGPIVAGDLSFTPGPGAGTLVVTDNIGNPSYTDLKVDDWSVSDINIDIAFRGTAFGLSVDSYRGGDSTFEVRLLLGTTVVDSFSFVAPHSNYIFVGFKAESPFDRVELVESVGGTGVSDREYFGRFFVAPEVTHIYYVDADASGANDGSSWADAFNCLQDALSAAHLGDELRVAQGAYKPDQGLGVTPGDRTASFGLKRGVAIKGGYAGFGEADPDAHDTQEYASTLSGDLNGDDGPNFTNNEENSYRVVSGADEAIIDGFTISGGNANGLSQSGYGIGGGLYNDNCRLVVANCTFEENAAFNGGAIFSAGGTLAVYESIFVANLASQGGALVNLNGHMTLTRCVLRNNAEGTIFCLGNAALQLESCVFDNNYGGWHAIDCSSTGNVIEVINSLFTHNAGGAINSSYNALLIVNSTLVDNHTTTFGGGVCCSYGSLSAVNCIMWGNAAGWDGDEIFGADAAMTVSYSCVAGGYPGTGNINMNPLFRAPASEDYHLLAGSPCINAGDPGYTPEPDETDLDGRPRVIGGRIDMGAYEVRYPRVIYVDDNAPNDPGPGDPQVGDPLENGTQAHPFDAIQEAIDAAQNGDTVIVLDGTYTGDGNRDVDFRGKALTIGSDTGPKDCIIDCKGSEDQPHRGFYFHSGEDNNSILHGFTISNGFASKWGGGIFCSASSPMIANCIFQDNTSGWKGGAIDSHYSRPKLVSCSFHNNSATWGGGLLTGGVYGSDQGPILINCTLIGNSVSQMRGGGGVYCESSGKTTLTNCILWGNTYQGGGGEAGQVYLPNPVVDYCCIEGWTGYLGGIGNMGADPLFADSDGRVSADSPCINAGDPDYVAEPSETDLDGKRRVIGGRIDMGAYEFNHIPVADAGPDQTVYVCLEGVAEVILDGSGSYDEDGQVLTYLWSWTVDGEGYEASGVGPAIELPVGEHVVELVVNNGVDDSEPDEVIITVVGPMESQVSIFPETVNRRSKQRHILVWVRLGEGVTRDQIDTDQPLLLYPGGIEATRQHVFEYGQPGSRQSSIFGFFDKAELMDAVPDNGRVELQVVGQLKTGQCFRGTDTVRIIGNRWQPWQRRR